MHIPTQQEQKIIAYGPKSQGLFFAIILFALSLSVVLSTHCHAADTPEETQKQLKQLKQRINKLQNKLNQDRQQKNNTQKALQKTELELGNLYRRLEKTQRQLKDSKRQLGALRQKQQQLQTKKQSQQDKLAADLRTAYSTGRQEYIKLLLNLEQPEKVSRTLRYYDYIQRARLDRINQFNQTLTSLDETTAELIKTSNQLNQLKKDLEQENEKLSQIQKQRQQTIALLQQRISSQDQSIEQLKNNQNRLQSLLNEVQDALADLPANIGNIKFKKRKGKLQWPTSGTVKYRFGQNRAQGRLKWNGLFIKGKPGSPVRAIHPGRIIFADWLRGYGLLIIIDHGDGYMSLYGHNQSLFKETGDWVNGGDRISSLGNSGGQKHNGLYFEIRKNGKPTNPARWLAKR